MTDRKHTPGPWERDTEYNDFWIYGAGGANSVCKVDSARQEADMELILRAPELLDENDRLRAENERLREALAGTLGLIRKAQERLCAHLHPDSSGDDHECLDDMLEIFDGPKQREIEKAARSAMGAK